MSNQQYTPTGTMPYTRAGGGVGPLELQDRGDVLSEANTFQCNAGILSVSNATPMLVTTDGPHYLVTGEYAIIAGSADAGANNAWTVTVTGADTLTLDGSVADGGGGAGGTITSAGRGTLGKLIDSADFLRRTLGIPAGSYFPAQQTLSNKWTFDSTTEVSFDAARGVQFTGTQPAATADPGANNLAYSTVITKAWANIGISGGASTLLDGSNIASATVSSNDVVVTFARNMANANYAVEFGVEITSTDLISIGVLWQPFLNRNGSAKTQSGFKFGLWDSLAGTIVTLASIGTVSYHLSINVKARQ